MKIELKLQNVRQKFTNKNAKEFSKLIDVPYTTYIDYEKGKTSPPFKVVVKICEFLNVSPNDLCEIDGSLIPQNIQVVSKLLYGLNETQLNKINGFILGLKESSNI